MSHASHPTYQEAQKNHVCEWCGGKIHPREEYAKWTWFDNGTATTVKSHLVCLKAANRTAYHWDEDGPWFNRDQPKGCDCGFDRSCCGMSKAAARAPIEKEKP